MRGVDEHPTHIRATYGPERWGEVLGAHLTVDEPRDVIPTPFLALSDALDGGLRPGEFAVVAGYTEHGKSVFADQMADSAAAVGKRVHLYMTEMTAIERGLRLLSRRTGIAMRAIRRRRLSETHWKRLLQELSALPYGCTVVSDWSIDEVCRDIRRARWDMAVVDLMHGFPYKDERDLDAITQALVRAAKGSSVEHAGTTILATAHLNDGQMRDQRSPKRPKPGLHSIKGASSIKQFADVVAMVWQQDDDEGVPTGDGAIWLPKCRQGTHGGVEVTLAQGRFQLPSAVEFGAAA
jgi:replicative DNA helicase